MPVPLGTFGIVDYLAGSARTVEAAITAARDHFRVLTRALVPELFPDDRGAWLHLVTTAAATEPKLAPICEEFTLAALIGRLRTVAQGELLAWTASP